MARAYEESKTKSKRLKASWDKKRLEAANDNTKHITKRCPLWLKPSKDGKQFILIPNICKAIEAIYQMRLDGKGKGIIVKELNQNPDIWKPPITKRNKTGGWQEPYVEKILTDPIVIGTFQPRQRDGKSNKEIAGEPIPNYYPPAISTELYYRVQDLIKRNKKPGNNGGQIRQANNLFVHLVRCGKCKTPMHHINYGAANYQYLRCDLSRRKLNCDTKGVRYNEVERVIFDNLEELDINSIIPNEDERILHLHDIERRLTANKAKVKEIEQGIVNLSDTIFNTKDKRVRERLENRMSKAEDEKRNLSEITSQLEREYKDAKLEVDQIQQNIDVTREVYQLLQSTKTDKERIDLRLRLRMEVKKIIDSIEIFPLQQPYKQVEETEDGIYQLMHSKSINKIKIRFKGSKNLRVLYLKTKAVKE